MSDCKECERLRAENAKLREALTHAMGWIESWSPSFTEDEAWPETLDMIRKALAGGPTNG